MKLWRMLTSRANSGLWVEKGNKRTRIDEEFRFGGKRRRGHRRRVVRSGKKEDKTMFKLWLRCRLRKPGPEKKDDDAAPSWYNV